MRQLILRIDDDLHARLKRRAKIERRSMNALAQELLDRELPANSVAERARELGLLSEWEPRLPAPRSREDAIADTRGAGRAISEAIEAERARR